MIYIISIKSICYLNSKFTYSKDVRLPVQLQRAMAAEAEAAREARAKVCRIIIDVYEYNSPLLF